MPALTGPAAIAALALAVAGAFKVADPAPTATVLRAVGIGGSPASGRLLGRLLGVVELAAAVAALAVGGWVWAPVAVLYAGFAALVAVIVWGERPVASCGCFGRRSARPSPVHVAADAVAALVVVAAAVTAAPGVADAATDTPWGGVPFLALVLLGTALFVVVLTELPTLLDAVRRPAEQRPVPTFRLADPAVRHRTTAAAPGGPRA